MTSSFSLLLQKAFCYRDLRISPQEIASCCGIYAKYRAAKTSLASADRSTAAFCPY